MPDIDYVGVQGNVLYTVQKIGVCKNYFNGFCSPRLHLFDQKCSKIELLWNITM